VPRADSADVGRKSGVTRVEQIDAVQEALVGRKPMQVSRLRHDDRVGSGLLRNAEFF